MRREVEKGVGCYFCCYGLGQKELVVGEAERERERGAQVLLTHTHTNTYSTTPLLPSPTQGPLLLFRSARNLTINSWGFFFFFFLMYNIANGRCV